MRRKSKILLAGATGAFIALLIPIFGPFTFYATVVPYLAPVLPRPDGVPYTATASFNWKGFGLFWEWETEARNGCARWGATKSINYSSVELVTGNARCKGHGIMLRYTVGDSYSSIEFSAGDGENAVIEGRPILDQQGDSCSFEVSNDQIIAFEDVADELHKSARKGIERSALSEIKAQFAKLNREKLPIGTRNDAECGHRVMPLPEEKP